MLLDLHEPDEVLEYVKQTIPHAKKTNLNGEGWADYVWNTQASGIEQVERKQWGELLVNPERVERQLRDELQAHPEVVLWLYIEGVIASDAQGIEVYKLQRIQWQGKSREVYMPNWHSRTSIARVQAWISQLERIGVRVKYTQNTLETSVALTQAYRTAQHPPTILQRHIKPSITFHPNSQVMTLLGAHKSGIGVELAERIIKEFGTVWNLVTHSPELIADNVEGMGVVKARTLLKAFGKEVE